MRHLSDLLLQISMPASLLTWLVFSSTLLAQVPFSTVKNDVLKEYTGVTVMERKPGVIEIDKSYIPNRKYYYAYVTVSNDMTVEGRKLTHHRDIVVTYDITSGKSVYSGMTKSDEWLVGDLRPPTLKEVQDIVNKDIGGLFTSYLANYITEFHGIKEIVKDNYPCYQCTNYYFPVGDEGNTVYFKAAIEYSRINGMNLEKRRDIFELTFYRDGINQPWIGFAKEKAEPMATGGVVLQTRALTSDEMNTIECHTLKAKVQIEESVSNYNNLPKVEIPKFSKPEEMAWWLHKFFRKAKPGEVEYVLLNRLQPAYFLPCGNFMLNTNGLEVLDRIKKAVSASRGNYGDHYCEIPTIKHQQGNNEGYLVEYYAKDGSMYSKIVIDTYNNEFKISDIRLGVYSKKTDIDAVMKIPASECKENIIANWKNYSLKEYDISASFPSEPAKKSFPDKPNKLALLLQFDKIEWAISAEKLSSDDMAKFKDYTKNQAYSKQLSEYTRKKYEATPGSDRFWQIRGARGYESNWTVKKDGIYMDMKYRSVIFKDVFYEIWVFGKCEQKDLAQFLESVAIGR